MKGGITLGTKEKFRQDIKGSRKEYGFGWQSVTWILSSKIELFSKDGNRFEQISVKYKKLRSLT